MGTLFIYKTKRCLRGPFKLLLLIFFVLGFWFAKPLLLPAMADFLYIPSVEKKCDLLIMNGGYFVSAYELDQVRTAWEKGLAEHLVIVFNENYNANLIGIDDYDRRIRDALLAMGFEAGDFIFLPVHFESPYTLHVAQAVADYCRQEGYKNALILCDSFHIRRTFLTYQKQFRKYGMEAFPYTYSIIITRDNWWKSSNGLRRGLEGYIKMAVYWYRGYILMGPNWVHYRNI